MKSRTLLLALALLVAGDATAAVTWRPRALLDLGWVSSEAGRTFNRHTQGDSQFEPYRVRLFLDAEVSPGFTVFLQSIQHEGGHFPIEMDAAYLRWTPWADRDLHVQAGKIPWPVGTWGPRTYSDKNRLIGSPLMFQYHTCLAWDDVARNVDQLVAAAGTGQTGLAYSFGHSYGMTIVDDRWWDVGVVALGSAEGFEFSLGSTMGTPGWPEPNADDTPGNGYLGRVGYSPTPELRFGVSGSIGPWMPTWSEWALAEGASLRDYMETTAMGDAALTLGRIDVQAEGFEKSWETLRTGTLRVRGGYVEASAMMDAGWWLAARAEVMRFSDVTPTSGTPRPWDDDIDRIELGGGYRITQDVRAKLAWQRNRLRPPGAEVRDEDMIALGMSIQLH